MGGRGVGVEALPEQVQAGQSDHNRGPEAGTIS